MTGSRGSRGSVTVYFLVLLPALLGLVGLVVEGAILTRQQIRLESAVDAAARAATDAYDPEYFAATGEVVINPTDAWYLAEHYLQENLEGATLIAADVNPAEPNRVSVLARSKVKFVFLPIVGITEAEIEAVSTAKKS